MASWSNIAKAVAASWTNITKNGVGDSAMLKEDGGVLLLETGDQLLVSSGIAWSNLAKS